MSAIKTRIYFCGGTGFNVGNRYGFSSEHVCFLDSSDANLKDKQIPQERVYLIPNTDGAGGDVNLMLPYARKHKDEMLAKFVPGEVCILVVGAGGGSGAAIALTLSQELLKQKIPTIIVAVSGTDSTRRLRNTTNFVKNLELVSNRTKLPVPLVWVSNDNGESEADNELLWILDALMVLTDQTNGRLDTQDIINWVQYNNLCSVLPQLVQLQISDNRQEAAAVLEPISIASLYTDPTKNTPFGTSFVRTVGIATHQEKMPSDQLHFILNSVGISTIMDDLEKDRVKLTTVQSGFQQRRAIVNVEDDIVEDDDFITS